MDRDPRWRRAARPLTAEGFASLHGSSTPAAIVSFHDGKFLDANSAFVETSGFERSELLDHDVFDVGFFDNRRYRNDMIRELEETGEVLVQRVWLRRRDGRRIDALLAARLLAVAERPAVLIEVNPMVDGSLDLIELTPWELDDEGVLIGGPSNAGDMR
jgi:PAS domain S-box-containing protein